MKKIFFLLLFALLALGLSQFLNQQNKKDLQDKTVVHLTLWNMPPKSLPLDRQIWEETVRQFESENPGIKIEGVEREYQPEEFITVMAGGKGPDLVKVWVGSIQTLAGMGFLEPLDSYITNWSQKDFIKPVLLDSTKIDSHFYGVPSDSYFLFLLYRKDLFKDAGLNPDLPPATWDELVSAAQTLTRRDKGQYGLGLVPKSWYFQDFVWQAGGEMIRMDGDKVHAAFNEAPAVKALAFWKDLRWKYKVLQPDVLMPESELLHLFALGKIGMIFGTENQLPALITRYKIDPQSFGIAPLPAGPAGKAAHLGGDIYVVNATTTDEKKAAAWKWIEYDLSPANQLRKWIRMHELKMLIFPGAFSSATNVANLPEFKLVQDALETARVEPHVDGWPQVRDLLDGDPLQSVFLDPDADPQQLLLTYAKEADRAIFNKLQVAQR
ncbi:MAG TPA: sugar ABC transporter substrate-binding protein [bacterium]|nr:sugar ABC transporter substrate-binding protein [bacterium]